MYKVISVLMISLFIFSCSNTTEVFSEIVNNSYLVTNGIRHEVKLNNNYFSIRDTLFIEYKLKNLTQKDEMVNFRYSPWLNMYLIDADNKKVIHSPIAVTDYGCGFILKPNEEKKVGMHLLMKDYYKNPFKNGEYKLIVYLSGDNYPKFNLKIKVKS